MELDLIVTSAKGKVAPFQALLPEDSPYFQKLLGALTRGGFSKGRSARVRKGHWLWSLLGIPSAVRGFCPVRLCLSVMIWDLHRLASRTEG